MKLQGVINRIKGTEVQTLGRFYLYAGVEELFSCVVLELSDKQNKKNISNICAGEYLVEPRYSKRHGDHFILLNVDGRSYILIHFGNYHYNTLGCLLFGEDFAYVNEDKHLDITNSKKTMKKLFAIAPDGFKLTINEI
tara:strand:- start:1630 stop:2043 length:414 start_codon:yes stop_codon:yes gene_type:complete